MKCKLLNLELAVGLVDPVTKRRPFIDPETGKPIADAHVPETIHWIRQIRVGDLVRLDGREPNGTEPIPPLTTRGGR